MLRQTSPEEPAVVLLQRQNVALLSFRRLPPILLFVFYLPTLDLSKQMAEWEGDQARLEAADILQATSPEASRN